MISGKNYQLAIIIHTRENNGKEKLEELYAKVSYNYIHNHF